MIHSGSVSSVSKYMGRLDIQQKSSKTYIDNIAQYIYCTMALDTHAQSWIMFKIFVLSATMHKILQKLHFLKEKKFNLKPLTSLEAFQGAEEPFL